MPYVHGYTRETEQQEPALVGFLRADNGATLRATRYGSVFTRQVAPNGAVTLLEAAALLHRIDPDSGELRPVTRIAFYQWAQAGRIRTVRKRHRPNTRPVLHVELPELRRFARANGFEFRRAN